MNEIRQIDALEPKALERFLFETGFLPLSYLPDVTPEAAARMQSKILQGRIASGHATLFEAVEQGSRVCLGLIEPLPFDSGVYGRKMGRVCACHLHPRASEEVSVEFVRTLVTHARSLGWDYLDFHPLALDIRAAAAAAAGGFRLVSTSLVIVWDLRNPLPDPPPTAAILREPTPDDAEMVGEMAAKTIDIFSRFAQDVRLGGAETAADVFRAWAVNSLRGYCEHGRIAEIDGKPVGYCFWRNNKAAMEHLGFGTAYHELMAVLPEERGQHVMMAMIHEGLSYLKEQGVVYCEAITNAVNGRLHRGAFRYGARTLSARHAFHWHA